MGTESTSPTAGAPLGATQPWWVICLCAQWCGTCREYRAVFDALAGDWPQVRFVWLDVEDEEDVVGDVDVETFPTILVADGRMARFLGPVLPQAPVLARMLQALQSDSGALVGGGEAQALFERIAASRMSS